MSLFDKKSRHSQDHQQQDRARAETSKHPGHDKAELVNQGEEQTPEQYAGEHMIGVEKKKTEEEIRLEAEKMRQENAPYIQEVPPLDDEGKPLQTSIGDANSSPNSPSSIAARSPLAPRDETGRFKKAVPDASGVSINGRPAYEHQHLMGHKGAQNPIYQSNNPASQVHTATPREQREIREGRTMERGTTNKLVDNAPEIAKPQQVKDDQARKAS